MQAANISYYLLPCTRTDTNSKEVARKVEHVACQCAGSTEIDNWYHPAVLTLLHR